MERKNENVSIGAALVVSLGLIAVSMAVAACDDGGRRDGDDEDEDSGTDADTDSDTDADADGGADAGEDAGPTSYCVDPAHWNYECDWPSGAACGMVCCGPCRRDAFYNTCAGVCCGVCNGECEVLDGDDCAGFCDGICEGSCTTLVDGQCTGDCLGECTAS